MADGAPRAADVSFDKPAQAKREGKVIKKAPAKPKSERDADAARAKEAARVAAREKAAVCDLCGNQLSVASRTCSMAWSFHAIDATSHPRAACVRWRGGARRSPYPNSLVDFPHRRPRPPRKLKLRRRAPRPRRRARRAPPRRPPRLLLPRRLLRPPRARSLSVSVVPFSESARVKPSARHMTHLSILPGEGRAGAGQGARQGRPGAREGQGRAGARAQGVEGAR